MLWLWRPLPLGEALTLLAMGPAAILGQYCKIRGFQLASTAQLVPVNYSGIAFAALLGLVVFDEWPRTATIAGAALIDRKSGVKGKRVSGRYDLGGRRYIKKKKK